jgi:outer membrane protein
VRAAESQRNIAESELRMTSLEIQDRARTAYFQVKAGESRIEAARLLAESTATASAAMQRGYELGTVTSVDVLNALRDQFRAQRDLQKARYDLMRWTLALYREAGTLSADDMQRMSEQLNAPPAP